MAIRLIMLGDIVGTPGRQAVAQCVPGLRERYAADLVIANAENAANGSGLTPELYSKICRAGVDAVTLGDHIYRKKQIVHTLETASNITRPANLPAAAPGKPWMRLDIPGKRSLFVVTVLGRLFMSLPADNPFTTLDTVLASLPEMDPIVLVEVHAEATSEKQALGWYLNGRVAAVVGTHTHVPTADARILPATTPLDPTRRPGTAYITDIGMCGPHESVIGRSIEPVVKQMATSMYASFDVPPGDPRVNGVFIEIDESTGRATAIERIEQSADPNAPPFVA